MCGIAGIVGPGIPALSGKLQAMADIMIHRGPDDVGMMIKTECGLAHRRLSIIDTSSAGRQPMVSACGRYSIIYNGEIYNYLELTEQYFEKDFLKTKSDTEILLELYAKKGPDCLEDLCGMFAFAIWDEQEKSLFLARDRFGMKPLYFTQQDGRFYFASEIKSFLAAGHKAKINERTVQVYLTQNFYDDDEQTFYEGIYKLKPGHCLRVKHDGSFETPKAYYDLATHIQPAGISYEEAREEFLARIKTSLHQHLRSDVRLGINVSGGVDSSCLVAMAACDPDFKQNILCFSRDFPGSAYSERPWVEQVLDASDVPCIFTSVSEEVCVEALQNVMWHQDEPFGGIPSAAWFGLFKTAQEEGVKVLLDGSGIDDFLAGYKVQVISYMQSVLRSGDTDLIAQEIESFLSVWGGTKEALLSQLKKSKTLEASLDGSKQTQTVGLRFTLAEDDKKSYGVPEVLAQKNIASELFTGMTSTRIPRALRFKDRISMAFSQELRMPFLDHRVVEFGLSLSESYVVRDGWNKYIFRDALKGIVPDEVRLAPKRSVQSPQREWFKSGPLALMLENALENPSTLLDHFVDTKVAKELYRDYKNGDDANANHLWQWLNLDLWHKVQFEGHGSKAPKSWPAPDFESYIPGAKEKACLSA